MTSKLTVQPSYYTCLLFVRCYRVAVLGTREREREKDARAREREREREGADLLNEHLKHERNIFLLLPSYNFLSLSRLSMRLTSETRERV